MSLLNSSNPFVGLRPFESDESLLFFGRQEQTLELLQRLHQHHFVAVVGSSGSGKSSLIRAGLIPRLKGGYLVDDRDKWIITIMKPGQSPLYNLADAVATQIDPGADTSFITNFLKKIKEEGADAILDSIKHLWETQNTNFFLLIDQFEELFRFGLEQKEAEKKDEAIDFVNIMLELSRQTALPIYVVITMRSDFIGDCAQFTGLPEAMNQSQYLVPKLNRVQLKTAIEGPVKLYGSNINPSLTSKLLNDVGQVKDELPLLQHALMRVWDHEMNVDKSGELDLQDYESIGGIEKALSNHADEALQVMDEDELVLTKKIFQALTAVDENGRKIRRPAHMKELQKITGADKEKLLFIINRFIRDKRSFLVISKTSEKDDIVIDISHESLIRQWNTLGEWVDEEAQSSKNYFRLVESAELYRNRKKDFLTGSELQVALQWCNEFKPVADWAQRYYTGFEESMQYLQESERDWKLEERKKKTRRRNQLIFIFTSVVAIIIALIFVNINQNTLRAQAETQRKIAEDSAVAARYQRAIADSTANQAKLAQQEAENQRERADSSAWGARNEQKKAELSASEARTQALLANEAKHEAVIQRQKADSQSRKIAGINKAFVLILKARQQMDKNPTLAIRLADAASKMYPDTLVLNEAKDIYDQHEAYYKTILKDTSIHFWDQMLSSDGSAIYTLYDNNLIAIHNADGKLLQTFKTPFSSNLNAHFSPDKTTILIDNPGDTAKIWSVNGTLVKSLNRKFYNREVTVAFSADNSKLIYNNYDSTWLWDLNSNAPAAQLKGIQNLQSATFSPDGKNILTTKYYDHSARLWDLSGKLLNNFKGHRLEINALAFSADGKKILTGSGDSTVRLFNVNDSNAIIVIKHPSYISSVSFCADGDRILTSCGDKTVRLWKSNGTLLTEFKGSTANINTAAFSPDGLKILTGSADEKSIKEWIIPVIPLEGHTKEINLVTFSPDGKRILTGSEDFTAKLWTLDGDSLNTFKHRSGVASVAFSPDDIHLLTAAGNDAYLWRINDTTPKLLSGHINLVQSVAFSSDGSEILTGSDDSTAVIWFKDGEKKQLAAKHAGGIVSVFFSHDGKKILTGSRDGTAGLWTRDGVRLQSLQHSSTVYMAVFSKDESMVLTASADNTANLWNLKDGKMVATFKHTAPIESVAFSPDGRILTGSHDHTAKLWNQDGKLLMTFTLPDRVRSVAFSPDGKHIVVGCADKIARVYSALTLKDILEKNELDPLTEDQKKDYGIFF